MRKSKMVNTLIIIGLSIMLGLPSHATNVSEAQKEKNDLEESLSEVEQMIQDLESKKGDMEAYLKGLDDNLSKLSGELIQIQNDLEAKKEQLEKTRLQLEEAKQTEEKQYQDMKMRIKFMYENGDSAYLEMILKADSFADLLNKADYVKKISEYDRDRLVEYQNTKQSIAESEALIEQECAQIEQLHVLAENQKAAVEVLVQEKQNELKEYKKQLKESQDLASAYEAEIEEQEELIKQLEAAAEKKRKEEAEKKRQAEEAARKANEESKQNSNTPTDSLDGTITSGSDGTITRSSGFVWPCPSSKVISSDYGYRPHPILGTDKMHYGIDIKAVTGSTIVAAASGIVIAASYSSSMGNYVMIDHGDEVYTIYMHCSALATSVGKTVSAAETIAYVGSTGRSTGPHLHFGVRKNGQYVSPWLYVS